MKHLKRNRKFGRKRGQRKAFMKSLLSGIIDKGRIVTTEARAKEVKKNVEKLVTRAKKQDIASLRVLISRISKKSAMKLFHDIAPKYSNRKGGYTRITKLSNPSNWSE